MMQPQGTWWNRNWKWVIPLTVGTPILVCAGFVTLLFSLVFGVIRSTEVYTEAVAAAKGDTAVVAAIGTPVEEGFMVSGNIEVSGSSGYADLAIPISGPNGAGTIYAAAEKYGGDWYFTTLEVAVEDTGEWIDLLGDP
jgi:hypothetical protein